MVNQLSRRSALLLGGAAAATAVTGPAAAQTGQPIRIGFSMALTGGLAPNGKSALLAQKIWEEDVNAKGGMLGRPVKLVYYDDQTNPATVPGIYTKLLDVDKVELIIGGYGTNVLAPAMPVMMQKNKVFIGLLGLGVNSEFNYPRYFVMMPSGPDPKPAFTKGFLELAMKQNPRPRTVAIVAADAEFSDQCLRRCARECQEAQSQCRLQPALSAQHHRLHSDRACDRGDQSGRRGGVLLSARLGRHRARGERTQLQAEDDRRRHGRHRRTRRSRRNSALCSTAGPTTTSGCRCRR